MTLVHLAKNRQMTLVNAIALCFNIPRLWVEAVRVLMAVACDSQRAIKRN